MWRMRPAGDEVVETDTVMTPATAAWYTKRAQLLMERWGPRYDAAVRDITAFEHRFKTAESRLQEYFDEQTALTESVNDPVLREQLGRRDMVERETYALWTAEGWTLLAQAQAMRRDLDDMNAVILKQELTVSMLNEYSMMSSIPTSVASLHESLSGFREQSDQLAHDLNEQIFNSR